MLLRDVDDDNDGDWAKPQTTQTIIIGDFITKRYVDNVYT